MAISGQEHPGVGYKIINIKLFCRVNGIKDILQHLFSSQSPFNILKLIVNC